MRRFLFAAVAVAFVAGCGDDTESAPSPDVPASVEDRMAALGFGVGDAEFPSQLTASPGGISPVSLCRVAWMFDGGSGHYVVDSMISLPEEHGEGGYEREVTTYVVFDLLDGWSPAAPVQLVLRVPGGEIDSLGLRDLAHAGFELGEEVGLFWMTVRPEQGDFNAGWPFTHDYAVFRTGADGTLSSEGVFLDPMMPVELGDLVRDVYESFEVPFDSLDEQDIDEPPLDQCPSSALGE